MHYNVISKTTENIQEPKETIFHTRHFFCPMCGTKILNYQMNKNFRRCCQEQCQSFRFYFICPKCKQGTDYKRFVIHKSKLINVMKELCKK